LKSNCPACHAAAVYFETVSLSHTIRFLVFPVWTFRKTLATCSECQVRSRVSVENVQQLSTFSADRIAETLVPERHQPWTGQSTVWALAAVSFCWFPIIGLIMCILAWRNTKQVQGGLGILLIVASGIVASLFTAPILVGLTVWGIGAIM
tara:strand:+ start:4441 stop:4890 length:450 start_codon:yes stop_codon:yes gene_type:complete